MRALSKTAELSELHLSGHSRLGGSNMPCGLSAVLLDAGCMGKNQILEAVEQHPCMRPTQHVG